MKAFLLIVIYITILFAGKSASAKIFDYSSTNLQLLHGNTYEFGDKERNIVTLEHNDGWKYGDNFAFVDMTVSNHAFARFSPRLSLSKISNKNLSYGIIKDVLVAGMVNYYGYHSKPHKNLLYGIGLNWDLPYFKFFQTNFYVRDNPDLSGKSHQVTFIWNLPIKISKHKLLIEGFAEIVSNEGKKYKSNQLVVPRLLLDVGNYLRYPDHVFTGVEWQYWHNKVGSNKTESVPQAMIKWVF